ncbi:hypothetical protein A9K97_gp389 [Tokyovirus A1]|uniref:hypothetical protein n=1 Tax=Tokyovirus A1 TaxID=1826170 RepID=UPI0007A987BE|nr:hypothetical protein A9K97_gp389 [Tokyovirus A1]BAU79962.1 hypothetical protein [Tokyovirus A1]
MPCLKPLLSFLLWFFSTIIFCSWMTLKFGGDDENLEEFWMAMIFGTVCVSWLCLVFALCVAMEAAR